jgi:hypothetical protein
MRQRNPERVRAWRQRIAAWKQSGQTINAFCRERKLTRSNFDRWRRILTAETSEQPRGAAPAFVPVRVVAEPVAEVVLPSGLVVRLPVNTAPEAVTRLVAAVGAARC